MLSASITSIIFIEEAFSITYLKLFPMKSCVIVPLESCKPGKSIKFKFLNLISLGNIVTEHVPPFIGENNGSDGFTRSISPFSF